MIKIVTFTGRMGVGKSTAIQILDEIPNTALYNVKFAEPLYRMQEEIYNIISSVYKRPADFVKDRKLLQWLGTEWGRGTISESLWIDIWKSEVKDLVMDEGSLDKYFTVGGGESNTIITCDDVRFDNEAEAVKSLGGIIIQLTSNKTDQRINTTNGISGHASEKGVDKKYIDYTIENNGTMEELRDKLLHVIK
jgi:hypothetical protein